MIDTQKLSQAIADASAYPAALEQLRSAWVEILNAMYSLGIPLPPKNSNGGVEREGRRLEYNVSWGQVSSVYTTSISGSHPDEQARALIALVPALIEYLERIAQTARDATVVADALRQALADERVQAALAMRALEKI
jgi:hypothetical protein